MSLYKVALTLSNVCILSPVVVHDMLSCFELAALGGSKLKTTEIKHSAVCRTGGTAFLHWILRVITSDRYFNQSFDVFTLSLVLIWKP